MSGSETVAKLIPARDAGAEVTAAPGIKERLAWPVSALVIIGASVGLWYGLVTALNHLFS